MMQRKVRAAPRRRDNAVYMLLFALRLCIGYMLMLIFMNYSVEMFVAVIAGIVVGHAMFLSDSTDGGKHEHVGDIEESFSMSHPPATPNARKRRAAAAERQRGGGDDVAPPRGDTALQGDTAPHDYGSLATTAGGAAQAPAGAARASQRDSSQVVRQPRTICRAPYRFSPGAAVEGRYCSPCHCWHCPDGEWYRATVMRMEDGGLYCIEWYDGTVSEHVPVEALKPAE